MEYLFSQTKVKPNISYDLCIVYEVVNEVDDMLFYNATLYLNGKNETNVFIYHQYLIPFISTNFWNHSRFLLFISSP